MKPLFIAEVKARSPFGFESEVSHDDLLDIAIEHGDMVAVHTDERWGDCSGHGKNVLGQLLEEVRQWYTAIV